MRIFDLRVREFTRIEDCGSAGTVYATYWAILGETGVASFPVEEPGLAPMKAVATSGATSSSCGSMVAVKRSAIGNLSSISVFMVGAEYRIRMLCAKPFTVSERTLAHGNGWRNIPIAQVDRWSIRAIPCFRQLRGTTLDNHGFDTGLMGLRSCARVGPGLGRH